LKHILIYHHNDHDGYLAATIVHKHLKESKFTNPIIFKTGDYTESFPTEQFDNAVEIWVLDYVLPWELMVKYKDKIWWIDHHESRIRHAGTLEVQSGIKFRGKTALGKSGTLLAWEFCNMASDPIPLAVQLVDDRDIWAWKFEDMTASFHEVTRSFISNYEKWERLLVSDDETREMVELGHILSHHATGVINEIIENNAWAGHLLGYKVAFLNCPLNISGELHKQLGEKYNGCDFIAIYRDLRWGKVTQVNLYRVNSAVDVGAISEELGGLRGRRRSAGFTIDSIKWRTLICNNS
jgi:hypothetical protein